MNLDFSHYSKLIYSSQINKNMNKLIILLSILSITGCATHNYVIDNKGVDMNQYAIDLEECQAISQQVSSTDGVAESAIAGAVVGAIVGAIGGDSDTAAEAGGIIGVEAGAAKASENNLEKEMIVKNCLVNRGYVVLN
jgi:hypothetical protein